MPIYSRNRTGFMEAAQTPADTSYGVNDFGRILYETQQNDMAFFEAILQADFNEVKGLNEGTILESEVAALNEASKNQLIQKIIEGMKRFLEKIKGIIKNAIDNIATYTSTKASELVGKFAYVAANKISNWNGSITIKEYAYNIRELDINIFSISSTLLKFYDDYNENITSAEVCSRLLNYNINNNINDTISPSEYSKAAIEICSEDKTYTKSNIKQLLDKLSRGRDYIKAIKNTEKVLNKDINSLINQIKSDKFYATDSYNLHNINVYSGMQSYATIVTKTLISIIRSDMKSKATALTKIIADVNKTPKELKEAYILEAAEDFDEIMNGEFNQGLIDDEARANIENLLKAAEE